jgi:Tfp pilus assembly protein PilO
MSVAADKRPLAPARGVLVEPTGRAVAVHEVRRGALAALGGRLVHQGFPRLIWSLSRTGRTGLLGLALLASSGIFYLSTQQPLEGEIAQLREDLAGAQAHAAKAPQAAASDAPRSLKALPQRNEIPKLLAVLLKQADAAQLTIDSAKYEIVATRTGALVRYQVAFPVSGPYTEIRGFIDSTLAAMPALAIEELSISRKSIADPSVEAQIRMTLFTRSPP